jgi:hypothetical protein
VTTVLLSFFLDGRRVEVALLEATTPPSTTLLLCTLDRLFFLTRRSPPPSGGRPEGLALVALVLPLMVRWRLSSEGAARVDSSNWIWVDEDMRGSKEVPGYQSSKVMFRARLKYVLGAQAVAEGAARPRLLAPGWIRATQCIC